MTIGPIEESFALLNKYGLHYSSHDSERVDSLTYSWKKVNSQVRVYCVLSTTLIPVKLYVRAGRSKDD